MNCVFKCHFLKDYDFPYNSYNRTCKYRRKDCGAFWYQELLIKTEFALVSAVIMMFILRGVQCMLLVAVIFSCCCLNLAGTALQSEGNSATDLRGNSIGLSWSIILKCPVVICGTEERFVILAGTESALVWMDLWRYIHYTDPKNSFYGLVRINNL